MQTFSPFIIIHLAYYVLTSWLFQISTFKASLIATTNLLMVSMAVDSLNLQYSSTASPDVL
jgi:membrane-bound acyltransferase YfiQ involved in biofilm formation